MRLRKSTGSTLRQRLRPDQAASRRAVARTFSYHTQRSDQATNTGRKFRQQVLNPVARNVSSFWLQRFGLGILLVVGGICFINALTLSNDVKFQQIGPNERSRLFHNQLSYQAATSQLLKSSLFNQNKLTVNTAKISQHLLDQYPELASANLALPLLSHRPVLYVSYTEPAIILHNPSGSFVLSSDGKVLTPTTAEAINLALPSVTDKSGFKLALKQQVLTSRDVSFIRAVVAGLKSKSISVSDLTLPPLANELDVAIAGQPYFVKFNLHAEQAKQQIGTFLAVRQHLTGESITPSSYIDVRVDGRAYYK